jgi:predicted metal-dependent RNase
MPDNVYFATVRNLLFNNPDISDVTIDETTGEITVKSDKNDNLLGKNFDVNLSINFNVNCNS